MAGSNSTSTREKLLGLVDDIELITKEICENAIAPKAKRLSAPEHEELTTLLIQKDSELKESIQFLVSSKRGMKIRNVQVESTYSRECLQQDLFLLSQQTIPNEFQSQNLINMLWRELPMSPRLSNCENYADIIFNVQDHLFCCHKVT